MFSNTIMRKDRSETGFSISELLVVMFIIGIVAAISVPTFILTRKNDVDGQVKSDIVSANNIIESWIIRHPSRKIPDGVVSRSASNAEISVSSSLTNQGLQGFKASPGTKLTITGSTTKLGTYTIKATNARGNVSGSANGMTFDSSAGGFQ